MKPQDFKDLIIAVEDFIGSLPLDPNHPRARHALKGALATAKVAVLKPPQDFKAFWAELETTVDWSDITSDHVHGLTMEGFEAGYLIGHLNALQGTK